MCEQRCTSFFFHMKRLAIDVTAHVITAAFAKYYDARVQFNSYVMSASGPTKDTWKIL